MGKKNIVMIMTDQQRWDAMGCVNPVVITPGIDSLAQNGSAMIRRSATVRCVCRAGIR